MKRRQLLRHLKKHGCMVVREGANHTIYENSVNGKRVSVGRHVEIDHKLARKICAQLDISPVN